MEKSWNSPKEVESPSDSSGKYQFFVRTSLVDASRQDDETATFFK